MVNIVTDQSHTLDAATPAEMVPAMSDNDSSLLKGSLLYQKDDHESANTAIAHRPASARRRGD
jgi:hypothetical protein